MTEKRFTDKELKKMLEAHIKKEKEKQDIERRFQDCRESIDDEIETWREE